MTPPQRYPSPAKQMLELGLAARAEGLSFDDFWDRAIRPGRPPLTPRRLGKGEYADLVGAIIWPSDTAERADAQDSMERSRDTWCRAYNRDAPTAGDLAMARLYAMSREPDAGGSEARRALPLQPA